MSVSQRVKQSEMILAPKNQMVFFLIVLTTNLWLVRAFDIDKMSVIINLLHKMSVI